MSTVRSTRSVSDSLLRIEGLRVGYPGDAPLVSGWSARIGAGITQLYGDTGSGKTSLLRVLAGDAPAMAGDLTLAGAVCSDDIARYRSHVFHVDARTERFDQMPGRLCLAALAEGDAAVDVGLRESLVEAFGLLPHIDKPLYMLSTGSKRKVWLAAALSCGRALTLLDEPSAALDTGSRARLWQALGQVAQRHDRAVIVASSERIDEVPLTACIELPIR
jgi:ABC-2 type transport system ATP-binding protein